MPESPDPAAAAEREPATVVVKTVTIRTTPDRLFPFFTDAAKMLEWIGTDVELEPWPDGIFRVLPNSVDVIRGTYLEVVPPSRVVFSWGFEGSGHGLPAGGSVVEITLKAVDGGTEVRLIHRALPGAMQARHDVGWGHYLARIATVAEGGDAGPDPLADPSQRHG